MRYALISDIHANLPALHAVFGDIDSQKVDTVICLGDIVGYGPFPREVIRFLRKRVDYFILGNHDAVVAGVISPDNFNDSARKAIEWTCAQMSLEDTRFFAGMPHEIQGPGFRATHGEFVVPQRFGYVFDEHEALASMASVAEPLLFIGHSHIPLVFKYRLNTTVPGLLPPEDFVMEPGTRYLVNVGSVGQPRDGGTRACYCIYDSTARTVQFRRVDYDPEPYCRAIVQAALPRSPIFFDTDSCIDEQRGGDFRPESEVTQRAGLKVRTLQLQPTGNAVKGALIFFIISMLALLVALLAILPRMSSPPLEDEVSPLGTGSMLTHTHLAATVVVSAPPAALDFKPVEPVVVNDMKPIDVVQDTPIVTVAKTVVSTPAVLRMHTFPATEKSIVVGDDPRLPFCHPGNAFTVSTRTPFDFWNVTLTDGQKVEFLTDGAISVTSVLDTPVTLLSAPITFAQIPRRVIVTPEASDDSSVFFFVGSNPLKINKLNSVNYPSGTPFQLSITVSGKGVFRIPSPMLMSEAIPPNHGMRWLPQADVTSLGVLGLGRPLQLGQKKCALEQVWDRWAVTSKRIVEWVPQGVVTESPASIEMLSPPVEIEWTKSNLHRVYLLTDGEVEGDVTVSLVMSLPDRRFWQIETRPVVSGKKVWLNIPSNLISPHLPGYALHLVIHGTVKGNLLVKEAGVQRL